MSRDTVVPWLLGRAAEHIMAASRVQGRASALPVIGAARAALAAADGKAPGYAELEAVRQALGAALAAVPGDTDNLFAVSQRRELQQARQAVESLALFLSGAAAAGLEGDRTAHAGIEMSLRPSLPAGGRGLRCLGFSRSAGRPVVPSLEPTAPPASVPERFQAPAPGVYTVRAVFEADIAAMAPIRFERVTCQTVLPGARLKLEGWPEDGNRRFRLTVTDAATPGRCGSVVTAVPRRRGDAGARTGLGTGTGQPDHTGSAGRAAAAAARGAIHRWRGAAGLGGGRLHRRAERPRGPGARVGLPRRIQVLRLLPRGRERRQRCRRGPARRVPCFLRHVAKLVEPDFEPAPCLWSTHLLNVEDADLHLASLRGLWRRRGLARATVEDDDPYLQTGSPGARRGTGRLERTPALTARPREHPRAA